jgi:hypothetical protein
LCFLPSLLGRRISSAITRGFKALIFSITSAILLLLHGHPPTADKLFESNATTTTESVAALGEKAKFKS